MSSVSSGARVGVDLWYINVAYGKLWELRVVRLAPSDVFVPGHENYPENLLRIPEHPSGVHVLGNVLPSDRLAVAIVGTRSPTDVGKWVAREMAQDMASAGVTIVSGLALGIDTVAHRSAIRVGGRTIACLGCGVDVVYPRENWQLFRDIPASGAIISEYPDGSRPLRWRFPERNRIIASLSLGVVVVEAGETSGALITASWALKYGIPVMAVPGSAKSPKSVGTHRLIQDGAYLVTSARDVLSFLGRETECVPLPEMIASVPPHRQLSLEESLVVAEIDGNPLSADVIAERVSGISAGRLAAVLSSLEMDGVIARLAGGKYLASVGQATSGKERG